MNSTDDIFVPLPDSIWVGTTATWPVITTRGTFTIGDQVVLSFVHRGSEARTDWFGTVYGFAMRGHLLHPVLHPVVDVPERGLTTAHDMAMSSQVRDVRLQTLGKYQQQEGAPHDGEQQT